MKSLTSTEAAKRLGLSPSTVVKLCDEGKLKHWRVPGSEHRRIRPDDLREFAERNGIPLDEVAEP